MRRKSRREMPSQWRREVDGPRRVSIVIVGITAYAAVPSMIFDHGRGTGQAAPATLNHFLQRLDAFIDQVLRAAAEVELADGPQVQAQVVVQRGPDFLERDGPLDRRARPGGWSRR